ncbi:MAG: YdcF family protein [Mariprofundaceae bacterium]|nr:YdcF family protein [Mariprofundaceae bacterium]
MSGLLIGKLVAQLLLPPGSIIVLAVAGLLARRKWWGKCLLVLSVSLLYLLSIAPVRDALIRPLEFAAPALDAAESLSQNNDPATTAIVLLGGGTREDAPEYAGADDIPRFAMMRAIYAAELAKKSGLDVYATGGRPLSLAEESEGAIMRRRLLGFGVSAAQVFVEEASENTWQNAVYMQRMLQDKGITRVLLVTSAWHMPRSVWCFEQQGLAVIPAPMDYLSSQRELDARDFFPDAGVLADSSLALHEYIGLGWYRLRYAYEN